VIEDWGDAGALLVVAFEIVGVSQELIDERQRRLT
jgi:hypothetical protein